MTSTGRHTVAALADQSSLSNQQPQFCQLLCSASVSRLAVRTRLAYVLADAVGIHEATLLKRELLIEKVKRTSPLNMRNLFLVVMVRLHLALHMKFLAPFPVSIHLGNLFLGGVWWNQPR
jgi:hypothetical protein